MSCVQTTSSSLREISLEELERHDGRNGSSWTCIEHQVYDISQFMAQHPGGSILRLAAGRDATTLFESSHPCSSMPRVAAALENKVILLGPLKGSKASGNKKFFETVRKRVEEQLKKKNASRHREFVAMTEVVLTMILYAIATYYTSFHASYFWGVILGFTTGRLGFLMHTGNHMGVSSTVWLNKVVGFLMDIAGSTNVLWAFEHQVAHHMDPNVCGRDNDCSIGDPLLRFHPAIQRRWWHRFQHISTLFGMSFGFFKWTVSDFVYYAKKQVGSIRFHVSGQDWLILLAMKGVWFCLHLFVPLYYHGLRGMYVLVLWMIIGAHYLENVFIVNHIQDELIPPTDSHWAVKQVYATANWASGSHFWNWFSGGLNHQIEHHLFPCYSHYVYPEISAVVQQTCKEFNLPYVNFSSFLQAWLRTMTYLKDLGTDRFDVKQDSKQE